MKKETGTAKTRERLLEAAGQVFAEKGYLAATGREICDRAGANQAAINYHFGGKEKLYTETLRLAHDRLVSVDMLQEVAASASTPEERIGLLIRTILTALLRPEPDLWPFKLIVREMAMPTHALHALVDQEIRPKSRILREAVAQAIGRTADDPVAARCSISIMAQCLMLMQNRAVLAHVFSGLDFGGAGVDDFADHVTQFSLAGLGAYRGHDSKEHKA